MGWIYWKSPEVTEVIACADFSHAIFFHFFFFHTTFSTSNTKFCTMVVASMGFSKSLVTHYLFVFAKFFVNFLSIMTFLDSIL
jgi:hypothetical protein